MRRTRTWLLPRVDPRTVGREVWLRRSETPLAIALRGLKRRAGDEASGFVCAGASRGEDRGAEPAGSGSPLWDRSLLRAVKQRLHQASFREAVISAYNGRCALSGLPEPLLLDGAHIVSDKDERLGQPVVPNGIPRSQIHHAAFDAHLIGIDPDYRLHVSERLFGRNDGAMLEAPKQLNEGTIHPPGRVEDRPDRDRLALRFERFKAVA